MRAGPLVLHPMGYEAPPSFIDHKAAPAAGGPNNRHQSTGRNVVARLPFQVGQEVAGDPPQGHPCSSIGDDVVATAHDSVSELDRGLELWSR